MTSSDYHHMRHALSLARRGLGTSWPNPAVGCVLVKHNQIIGCGWTQAGGRPHAETEALEQAGELAEGATAYVTLEPCAHHGKTPPCTEALIAAKVARVVIACVDPDPRVSGKGIAKLKSYGIEVETGIREAEAIALNAGFFKRIQQGLPFVTLKLATTLDGKIACANGQSQWITSDHARLYSHKLRADSDAILVGSGTAIYDAPLLNCRLPGLERHSPQRVILDRRGRVKSVSPTGITNAQTWIITASNEHPLQHDSEIELLSLSRADASMKKSLKLLAERGITRVLVEGGAEIATALIKENLVDELVWIHASTIMGSDGLAAVGALDAVAVDTLRRYVVKDQRRLGIDILTVLTKPKLNEAS